MKRLKKNLSYFSFFWELFRSVVPPSPLFLLFVFLTLFFKFFWLEKVNQVLLDISPQMYSWPRFSLYLVDCSLAFSLTMSYLSFVDLNYWANGVLLSKSCSALSEFQVPDWSLWTFWSWLLSCVTGRNLISFFMWPPSFSSSICCWWLSLIQCI